VSSQIFLEDMHCPCALPLSPQQKPLLIQINEQADVVVPSSAGCLIDPNTPNSREISVLPRLIYVMVHDAP